VSTLKSTIRQVKKVNNPKGILLARARKLALMPGGKGLNRAFALLKEAASAGNYEADYAIGTWYAFGKHVPQSDEMAVKYFKRAARKKYGPAMFDLAMCYETERGVARDLPRAFELYVQAAREGDKDAGTSVYRCLYHGIGVSRNRKLAELVADMIDHRFARKRTALPR
jgi:uncharacterized protein